MNRSSIKCLAAALTLSAAFSACNSTDFSTATNSQKQGDLSPTGGDPTTGGPVLPPPNSTICEQNPRAPACDRTPAVASAGVVTILFTMGQIPQAAATLIVANAIKYASPIANPKILFLKDTNTNGEDEGDPDYIKNVLLAGYDVEYRVILPGGLRPAEVAGKDLVIVSNPGYPLSDMTTLNTLKEFRGGAILMGDDMGAGTESLTGLQFGGNGSSVSCNGNTYGYDNSAGYQYQVSMNPEFLPGIADADKNYGYGNDIDHTVAHPGVQVLATASAAPGTCDFAPIPAVARKPR